jgi:hypothetical protein
MLTTYDDEQKPPVSDAVVGISVPIFEAVDDTTTQTVKLEETSSSKISFKLDLTSHEYHVAIPASKVFGPDYGKVLQRYTTSLIKDGNKLRLSDLTDNVFSKQPTWVFDRIRL